MEQVWSVCLLASVLTPLEHWRYAYKLRYGKMCDQQPWRKHEKQSLRAEMPLENKPANDPQ